MKKYTILLFLLLLGAGASGQQVLSDTTLIVNGHPYRFLTTYTYDDGNTTLTIFHNSKIAKTAQLDIEGLPNVTYPDFNSDGNNDILISSFGMYNQYELYLYDELSNSYRLVDDNNRFPSAKQLGTNPGYYYSYQATGCADMYWVSSLFFIKDFRAIPVGKILGNCCGGPPNSDPKDYPLVISIYKIANDGSSERLVPIEELPYHECIPNFEDKWNFIEKYWNKNYKKYADE